MPKNRAFLALCYLWWALASLLHFVGMGEHTTRGRVMAMARFSVMYFGHFILFSVFLLFYVILLVGLITRMVKRSVAEARGSQ
jgi:hypothetical protein